jgi:hypothetical protein
MISHLKSFRVLKLYIKFHFLNSNSLISLNGKADDSGERLIDMTKGCLATHSLFSSFVIENKKKETFAEISTYCVSTVPANRALFTFKNFCKI